MKKVLFSLIVAVSAMLASAQTYEPNVSVQTFAGDTTPGYEDGPGGESHFYHPYLIATDNSYLYVWDWGNHALRKVTGNATVSTLGTGTLYFNFNSLTQVPGGDLIAAKYSTHFANIQDSTGAISDNYTGETVTYSTAASDGGIMYFSAYDQNAVYKLNGLGYDFIGFATIPTPGAMTVDHNGNIFVWSQSVHKVYKITSGGTVSVFSGSGVNTNTDASATSAAFKNIYSMAVDTQNNIYTASDTCVRKISPTGAVTTMGGSFTATGFVNGSASAARFNGAVSICVAGDVIYVADDLNHQVRIIGH